MFVFPLLYWRQVGLPSLYGIQVQDMEYYLSFALVIIFFQLCVDVFIHGVLELFHGWKIYDYLVRQGMACVRELLEHSNETPSSPEQQLRIY